MAVVIRCLDRKDLEQAIRLLQLGKYRWISCDRVYDEKLIDEICEATFEQWTNGVWEDMLMCLELMACPRTKLVVWKGCKV